MSEKNILRVVVDDGTKEVPITNKFGKLICKVYFRPADFSIVDRYNDLVKGFDKLVEPIKNISIKADGTATFDKDWETIKSVEQSIKDKINELFDMEEADEIFAKRNAFSSVGGEFFCLHVINALGGVITKAIADEEKLTKKRLNKYLSDVEPINVDEVTANAGAASDNSEN